MRTSEAPGLNSMQMAMDKCIPKMRITGTNRRKFRLIWMNENTLAKVQKKHQAWKRYKLTQDVYATASNQERWATRNVMGDLEKTLAKDIKENPKAFWKYASSKSKSQQRVSEIYSQTTGA